MSHNKSRGGMLIVLGAAAGGGAAYEDLVGSFLIFDAAPQFGVIGAADALGL